MKLPRRLTVWYICIYSTIYEDDCTTSSKQATKTKCSTKYEEKCETVTETSYEEQCSTEYSDQCRGQGYSRRCSKVPQETCRQVPVETEKEECKQVDMKAMFSNA